MISAYTELFHPSKHYRNMCQHLELRNIWYIGMIITTQDAQKRWKIRPNIYHPLAFTYSTKDKIRIIYVSHPPLVSEVRKGQNFEHLFLKLIFNAFFYN